MSDESEAQGSSQYRSGYGGSSEIVVIYSDDTSEANGNTSNTSSDNSD